MTSGEALPCCKSVMYTQVLTLLLYSYTARSIHAAVKCNSGSGTRMDVFLTCLSLPHCSCFRCDNCYVLPKVGVGMETGWKFEAPWFDSRQGRLVLPFSQYRLWGLSCLMFSGYRERFPREWSGRSVKAHYSHLLSAEVKVECCLYLHSHICLHGLCKDSLPYFISL